MVMIMAFVDSMSEREIDALLDRFDATESPLQRRIVAELMVQSSMAKELLEACRSLLVCSLPRDVAGERAVDKARVAVGRAYDLFGE